MYFYVCVVYSVGMTTCRPELIERVILASTPIMLCSQLIELVLGTPNLLR